MSGEPIPGIHHVTAIAGDPQRNVDFYAKSLGLRLVKVTVNFDDPGSYHLYFGDETGSPGSIITFFPWPGAPRGRVGAGQFSAVSFSVPPGAREYWAKRLERKGVRFEGPRKRFDEEFLSFRDPDGLGLELVFHPGAAARAGREGGGVPPEHAIRGLHGVTLVAPSEGPTEDLLVRTMGFAPAAREGGVFRFASGRGGPGSLIDVAVRPGLPPGHVASGTIHHVAWRAPGDEEQLGMRRKLVAAGCIVTAVVDRKYFRSIYFREPAGALLEIATDAPGFAVDEPPESLGSRLLLPAWLEGSRDRIVQVLPPLRLPQAA
jgi:glyoxalase family protein